MSIQKLYCDLETADIFFTFTNSPAAKIPAHKCILAAKSNIFMQIFYDKSNKCSSTIQINGVSAESFAIFLDLFYQRKLRIDLLNIMDVIHLSNTYQVTEWKEVCSKFLDEQSNLISGFGLVLSNVFFDTIKLTFCCNQSDVLKFWEKLIQRHIFDIIRNENFLSCSQDVLNIIIGCSASIECDDNERNAKRELFERCIAWAERKYNQSGKVGSLRGKNLRNQLAGLFDLVWFGSMAPSDFVYVLSKHGNMFSVSEIQQISEKIQFNSGKKQ